MLACTGRALPDTAGVERELDRLKIERERLGAVNLRPRKSRRKLSDRLAALIKERDDIIDAIRKLRAGDPEPQPRGRERLIAALRCGERPVPAAVHHLFNVALQSCS